MWKCWLSYRTAWSALCFPPLHLMFWSIIYKLEYTGLKFSKSWQLYICICSCNHHREQDIGHSYHTRIFPNKFFHSILPFFSSWTLYKWNHIACTLLCLVSLAQSTIYVIAPCYANFFLSFCSILMLICLYSLSIFPLRDIWALSSLGCYE